MARPDDISKYIHMVRYKAISDLSFAYQMVINIVNATRLSPNYEEHVTKTEKDNLDHLYNDAISDMQEFNNFNWD
jgi:hypothetical protein